MKILQLLTILTALNFGAYSQTYQYHSFPQDTGYWKYSVYGDFGNHIGWDNEELFRDTVYNQSLMTDGRSFHYYEQNKTIYRVLNDSTQIVLFDFNLTVGDTIFYPFSYINGDTIGIIGSDDSLFYHGRRALAVTGNYGVALWVEGIGNIHSYFSALDPLNASSVSGGRIFECLYADSVSVPCSNAFELSSEKVISSSFEIYPNPCVSKLQIKMQGSTWAKVEIITLTGKHISTQYSEDLNDGSIDVSDLPAGSYFIKITLGNTESMARLMKMN